MNVLEGILKSLDDIKARLSKLEFRSSPQWVYLPSPLTSTSWDGDAHSTTAKTKIDLSAVFSAPAGIKAVYVRLQGAEDASVNTDVGWGISPNDTDGSYAVLLTLHGIPNTYVHGCHGECPCDANGDIYYQVVASGATSLAAYMQIWGYYV